MFCYECELYYDEPAQVDEDIEQENGVGGLFPDHHHMKVNVCPFCGSADIDEDANDITLEQATELVKMTKSLFNYCTDRKTCKGCSFWLEDYCKLDGRPCDWEV